MLEKWAIAHCFGDAYIPFSGLSLGLAHEVAAIATFGGKSFLDPSGVSGEADVRRSANQPCRRS
jgi:hypothetical protein